VASKLIVGIDIGQRDTKVVVLEKKVKLGLVDAFSFPSPFVAGQVEDKKIDADKFKHEFNEHFSLEKLRSARVAMNLPAAGITAMLVQMPMLTAKELAYASVNEAKQKMIPHSGPAHIFECLMLGDRTYDQTTKSEVLVVRTEKKYVDTVMAVFDKTDISPVLVVPTPFVVGGMLPRDVWKKDEDIAFVEIGAMSVNFFICRESKLVFHRNIVFGLAAIIKDLANKLDIDEERMSDLVHKDLGLPKVDFNLEDKVALAEEIMRQKYEASSNPEQGEQNGINQLEFRMHWQPHLDRIIQEFRRSLAYYKDQSRGRRVESIYFLGGCCRIKNFVATVSASIGGQCQELLPFKNLQVPGDKFSPDNPLTTPVFANAVGLAMGTLALKDKHQAPINFLPEELRKKETKHLVNWIMVAGLSVFSFLAAAFLAILIVNNGVLSEKIRRVEFDLNRTKEKQIDVQSIVEKEARIQERKAAIDTVKSGRRDMLALLRTIADMLPREVLFKKADISDKGVEIEAQINLDFEQSQEIVDEVEASFKADPRFMNISVSGPEMEPVSSDAFAQQQGERLTASKARDFKIKAELSGK